MNAMRYRLPPLHWAYNLARFRPINEPITEMNRYDAYQILQIARAAGCDGAFTVPVDQNGHKGIIFIGKVL